MITKNTLLKDIIDHFVWAEKLFLQFGIGSIGSVAAFCDTVGESAALNGVDPDTFVTALNTARVK